MPANVVRRLALQGFGAFALLFTFAIGSALAQAGASTGLMGRVTDSSGAAVPGVAVTLTNVETGSGRTATTNSTGDWEARFLTPGTYRITFELTGFKMLRREGVTVSTAEMATVNVSLEIGGLAEAVQVVANAEMVSSGSMTVSRTLDQKELDALPTSARNFTQLLVIEPGVSADISELLSNDNASISPSVNGAHDEQFRLQPSTPRFRTSRSSTFEATATSADASGSARLRTAPESTTCRRPTRSATR